VAAAGRLGPLCEFLEVDPPDEPLPTVNNTPMFKAGIMAATVESLQAQSERERPPEP